MSIRPSPSFPHPSSETSQRAHASTIRSRTNSKLRLNLPKMASNKVGSSPPLDFPPPSALQTPLNTPARLLMGPGPSNCSQRVLDASARPLLNLWHPEFYRVLDDIKAGIQYIFQTQNEWTWALSGPGHLAMEAMLVNLLEPGDSVLIGVHGIWGERASIMAERAGAKVHQLKKSPGSSFTFDELAAALENNRPKLLFLVHSESSTGVVQNLEGVGALCRKYNTLLAVDTVASLGGVPFFMDKWGVDAVYTGSQKVIGAPPGLAPMSFGKRAVDVIKERTARGSPPRSYFLDMNMIAVYWDANGDGAPRAYHHTPPINLYYALREALAAMGAEGLGALWARHQQATQRLHAGLRALGLELFVEREEERLRTVTAVRVPAAVDWKRVVQYGLEQNVEIAGGLGPTVGKIFRIGVMGENATVERVDKLLKALGDGLTIAKQVGHL